MSLYTNCMNKSGAYLYVFARVVAGLMFMMHGGQKLFGWFGGNSQPLASLMGVAGVIELIGGLAIALGFFSRLAAMGSALLMIIAYFKAHFPGGWIPLVNKGELALLYMAFFILIMIYGNGKLSLEKSLLKKEVF